MLLFLHRWHSVDSKRKKFIVLGKHAAGGQGGQRGQRNITRFNHKRPLFISCPPY